MNARDLASEVVETFRTRGRTLATCESLTGGLVAATITDVPGASVIFRGALVTYASDLKSSLAGVDAGWIAAHGVINARTAIEMAVGARQRLGSDVAVSCTGVAGPDPQDSMPPGTVWIARACARVEGLDEVVARRLQLAGDRSAVREATVQAVLELALE